MADPTNPSSTPAFVLVDNDSPDAAPISIEPPTTRLLYRDGATYCGACIDDRGALHVVGGLGHSAYVVREPGHEALEERDAPGQGLRGILVEGDDIWLCGEHGFTTRSEDRGGYFKAHNTHSSACLHGMTRDHAGRLWVFGANGYAAIFDDEQDSWRPIDTQVRDTLQGCQLTSIGLMVASDKGRVFLCSGESLEPMGLHIHEGVCHMDVTPRGTIVVVADGGEIWRSEDRGETFTESTGYSGTADLNRVVCMQDGRVVAAGARGTLLYSSDDAVSFVVLDNITLSSTFYASAQRGGTAIVAGTEGVIVQVGG